MSKATMIVGALGCVIFLLHFVWLVVALHMAYTKADELFGHLKNSPAIIVLASSRHGGPWGRLWMLSSIALSAPGRCIENGTICAEDIENLPMPIKRKLVFLWQSLSWLVWALVSAWAIVKIFDL